MFVPLVCLQLRLLFRLREVADAMQYLHDTARVVHGGLSGQGVNGS